MFLLPHLPLFATVCRAPTRANRRRTPFLRGRSQQPGRYGRAGPCPGAQGAGRHRLAPAATLCQHHGRQRRARNDFGRNILFCEWPSIMQARRCLRTGFLTTVICSLLTASLALAQSTCKPTPRETPGPFYKANAPERESTGQGFVVSGTVRSTVECRPLGGARIEWWAANTQGDYDDAHRATQRTDADGRYRYETDFPGLYPGRPVHLHVRITAVGHRALITQLYPKKNDKVFTVDLVLEPE